uniref:Uncharacterized protein n=1 Tax=Cacopsylla melanoneura TaxID=428564 RepID=A0A8D8T8P2_9HEMI
MELKSFKQSFKVNNFDFDKNEQKKKRHGDLFPNTIRAIICGKSNCGKTNLMLSLIVHPNGLRFRNIYVYSKSLHQPKYVFLKQIMDGLNGVVKYFQFVNSEDVLSPSQVEKNSVIIFDDVICNRESHMILKDYYVRARHYLCDTFFLAQTYSAIPKQLLRDNANFFVLYKMDELNLRHVYSDVVSTDMSFDKFRSLCSECWNSDKYGFLTIDRDADTNHGRYRFGLDKYFTI